MDPTIMRPLLLSLALAASTLLAAQTQIIVTNITLTEKEAVTNINDVTLPLNGDEGSKRQVIYMGGNTEVKMRAKVTTHNVRRSSLKDSAVNITFEIDVNAGKDHDNKRVEKVFYLDQSRKGTVTERFNFKDGITMRGITLKFDVEIK
jgi:hypothetical protein